VLLTARCTDIDLARPADGIFVLQMFNLSLKHWEKPRSDYALFCKVSDVMEGARQRDSNLDGVYVLFTKHCIPRMRKFNPPKCLRGFGFETYPATYTGGVAYDETDVAETTGIHPVATGARSTPRELGIFIGSCKAKFLLHLNLEPWLRVGYKRGVRSPQGDVQPREESDLRGNEESFESDLTRFEEEVSPAPRAVESARFLLLLLAAGIVSGVR